MENDFKGNRISYNLVRGNIRKEVSGYFAGTSEDDFTDALVKYDPKTNTVAVDEHASDDYAKYAAIHECICCGPYGHLAPEVDNPNKRCGAIDKMIVAAIPKQKRAAYIAKRIEMFETLIEKHLNQSMEPAFHESLKMLKAL